MSPSRRPERVRTNDLWDRMDAAKAGHPDKRLDGQLDGKQADKPDDETSIETSDWPADQSASQQAGESSVSPAAETAAEVAVETADQAAVETTSEVASQTASKKSRAARSRPMVDTARILQSLEERKASEFRERKVPMNGNLPEPLVLALNKFCDRHDLPRYIVLSKLIEQLLADEDQEEH